MMTLPDDETLKMAGDQALFSLSSGILLMMAGVRVSLDERTLREPQIKRLYSVYAALATCATELTEIAVEIDA